MATAQYSGTGATIFNPVSSQLANLPDAAGTLVALVQAVAGVGTGALGDIGGLTDGSGVAAAQTNWYHNLTVGGLAAGTIGDDDGTGSATNNVVTEPTFGTTAWWIVACSWPGTGASVERFSYSQLGTVSWTHVNSSVANGGLRAGPTTTAGQFNIGYFTDESVGENVGLIAAWAGVQLTDLQIEALLTHSKTSDWWTSAAGQPTLLVENTSLTPTDIGAHPSTFSNQVFGEVALSGGTPTGWTFDGQGSGGGGSASAAQSITVSTAASGSGSHTGGSASAGDSYTLADDFTAGSNSFLTTAAQSITVSTAASGSGTHAGGSATAAQSITVSSSASGHETASRTAGDSYTLSSTASGSATGHGGSSTAAQNISWSTTATTTGAHSSTASQSITITTSAIVTSGGAAPTVWLPTSLIMKGSSAAATMQGKSPALLLQA